MVLKKLESFCVLFSKNTDLAHQAYGLKLFFVQKV